MKKEDVVLKGTREGLILHLDEEQDFQVLKSRIREKLAFADHFLVGAHVMVNLGHRDLTDSQLRELEDIFLSYGLTLKGITTGLSPYQQPLAEVCVPAFPRETATHKEDKETACLCSWSNGVGPVGQEELDWEENTVLVRRTLRNGQVLQYPGNVVILGDVNPGAQVVAGGNIIVMGVLRGIAHAGASGNEEAVVTAFRLLPTQLRIANHITRSPDGDYPEPEHPEIARIRDGIVTIENYNSRGPNNQEI